LSAHTLDLGDGSAVEPSPWHYGADYVTVYFKGEKSRLKNLVPAPFILDDGTCMAYVCEIISVSGQRPQMVSEMPERTIYMEAALGIKCLHGTSQGMYFPVMWVDSEWSLLRGLVNGYPKRLADSIVMTKLHPLNPGLKLTSKGATFAGYCVKGSETTLRIGVEVEKRGGPADLISFGSTFGMRKYPRTNPSQTNVAEAVEILRSNYRVSDVWVGTGSVALSLDVGEPEMIRGLVYRSGFTISGSRVLERL
jgi:hypothetical protein